MHLSDSSEMSEFGGSVHRLAGSSGDEVGGLIIKKKAKKDEESSRGDATGDRSSKWDQKPSEFKVPAARASLLGLDVLAKRKREEREAAKFGEKRLKLTQTQTAATSTLSTDFSEDGARVSFGRSSEKMKERAYRGSRVETPSYTGGVSEKALDRIQQRMMRREKQFAVGAKSRDPDSGRRCVDCSS